LGEESFLVVVGSCYCVYFGGLDDSSDERLLESSVFPGEVNV
jgi:hypothetical protein